jgi:hypothetical protein
MARNTATAAATHQPHAPRAFGSGLPPATSVAPVAPSRAAPSALAAVDAPACRLCGCRLNSVHGDSFASKLCRECGRRPEARSLPVAAAPSAGGARPPSRREFGVADKALIRSVHAFMPAAQLLGVLNSRLVANDPSAAPFSLEQLQDQIRTFVAAGGGAAAGGDWASLRKTLALARTSGLLASISPTMLQDFAVVFSLSPAQLVRLKDVLADASDDGDDA